MNTTSEIDTITETLLIKLQEECAEVIQIVSKILLFGSDNWHPDDPTKSNLDHLEQELGDVLAVVDLLVEAGIGITNGGLTVAKIEKFKKLVKYHKDIAEFVLKM